MSIFCLIIVQSLTVTSPAYPHIEGVTGAPGDGVWPPSAKGPMTWGTRAPELGLSSWSSFETSGRKGVKYEPRVG